MVGDIEEKDWDSDQRREGRRLAWLEAVERVNVCWDERNTCNGPDRPGDEAAVREHGSTGEEDV